MQTLRDYLRTNSWIAMTSGMTTDAALDAFQKAGCDVDAVDVLAVWRRHAFGADDLPKVVRGKLEAAVRGERVWTAREAKVYPGSAQFVPRETLTSHRRDEEAQRIRVTCRVRADMASIETVAAEEGITTDQVRAILAAAGLPPKPKKRAVATKTESVVQRLERAEAQERARHREAVAAFYRQMGRQAPSWPERRAE